MASPVPVRPTLPLKLIFIFFLLIISIYFIFYFWKNREKENLEKNLIFIESPKRTRN